MYENWFWWKEIITGIVIGITVSIIVGFFKLIEKCDLKRKQKKRIKEIIDMGLKNIKEARDITLPNGTICPKDRIRKYYYDELSRDVHETLSHKSSEISLEDEQKIKKAFQAIPTLLQNKRCPNIEIYRRIFFSELKKVKWLKLQEE